MWSTLRVVASLSRQQQQRCLATHWNPKFKTLRKQKVIKPDLPDYEKVMHPGRELRDKTTQERRAHAIKEGIDPPISFEYKPINITTSSEIFDRYVPPEGDGKVSPFSTKFIGNTIESFKKRTAKWAKHSRQIVKYDPTFNEDVFVQQAQEIYSNAHQALMK